MRCAILLLIAGVIGLIHAFPESVGGFLIAISIALVVGVAGSCVDNWINEKLRRR